MAVPQHTLALLRRLARHNGGIIDATVRDITTGWLRAWDDLGPAWQQAVTAIVDQYAKTGVWPAPWQVTRIEAIARATQSTEQSLTRLLTDAATATQEAAGRISAATLAAEPSLIASQTSKISADDITVPSSRAGSALDARRARIGSLFRPVGASVMAAITWEFTHAPNLLRRPLSGLQDRVKAGFDAGLVRAVTIAQTETVDAYRTASGLVHAANPSVVTGWCWICQCDLRSCIACWAMHGVVFDDPASPGPLGHPGCRCARLPVVSRERNPLPNAQKRFARLSRKQQMAIMGPARLSMLKSGSIHWGDLAAMRIHRDWRPDYTPRTVADLRNIAGVRG